MFSAHWYNSNGHRSIERASRIYPMHRMAICHDRLCNLCKFQYGMCIWNHMQRTVTWNSQSHTSSLLSIQVRINIWIVSDFESFFHQFLKYSLLVRAFLIIIIIFIDWITLKRKLRQTKTGRTVSMKKLQIIILEISRPMHNSSSLLVLLLG